MRTLTQAYLKEVLDYNDGTGIFRWKIARSNRVKIGHEAGFLDKIHNYKSIRLDGKFYRLSRLAWFYTYGKWPEGYIDHINHDTIDNRINNLRDATPLQNQANRRLNKNSTSGFKGVSFFKKNGKWRAMIACNHIGYYETPEEAHTAYLLEAKKRYGEFACGS